MSIDLAVMPHMSDFVSNISHPNVAMVAGVGSGKTIALQQKAILLSLLNPGCLGILASPTFSMLERNILNMRNGLAVQLQEAGIPFDFKGGNTFFLRLPGGVTSEIECTHAGASVSGRTAAWFGVDEIDLMHTTDALDIWDILSARLRDPNGRIYQGFCASTPEGHKFLYTKFVDDLAKNAALADDFVLYHATTYDNFLLPPGFIERLEKQYDPKRLKAHLMGEFVSLTDGLVYEDFDRKLNHTDEVIETGEDLHIGVDMNNNGMSACICTIRDNQPRLLDEVMGSTNTLSMVQAIRLRYPNNRIIAYPDASGAYVRSTTSSETDHNIMKKEGNFVINTTPSNPHIMDRVGSVRALICNSRGERRLKVNTKKCPIFTGCIEQQTFRPDGMPQKGVKYGRMALHTDGPLDAIGYFLDRRWPTRRPPATPIRVMGI